MIELLDFLYLNPYIAADELHAGVVSRNAGSNAFVIFRFQSVDAEIGADDGRPAGEQAGVDNIVKRGGCELGDEFGADVVENQQVAAFQEIEGVLLVLASAEMQVAVVT